MSYEWHALTGEQDTQAIAYAARIKPGLEPRSAPAPRDPEDFLAPLVMYIPDPHRHVIRSRGAYSSVLRPRQRREAAITAPAPVTAPVASVGTGPADPDKRALRRRWADLLRRI